MNYILASFCVALFLMPLYLSNIKKSAAFFISIFPILQGLNPLDGKFLTINRILFVPLVISWVLSFFLGKTKWKRSPFNIPLYIFIGSQFLALLFSLNKLISVKHFFMKVEFILLFFITLTIFRSIDDIKKIVRFWIVSCFFVNLYGILENIVGRNYLYELNLIPTNIAYYIRDDIRGGFGRSSSIFGQPIAYGFYLIILFYFYIFLLKQGMLKRSWYIVLNIIHIIAIFLTISRSIWVAFIISLFFFTSLWGFRRKSYFAQILPIILIGILLLFPLSRGKLYDFAARSFSSYYEESSNIRARIGMIKAASIVVRERYLTGLGPGYPWHMREKYLSEGYDFHSYENTFLLLFLESGLLGLSSFILFILASLNWNYKMARKAKALPEIRLFISSVFSILVGYLIMTFTVNVFGFYNLQHMIMVVLAFAIIIISNRQDLHPYYQRSY